MLSFRLFSASEQVVSKQKNIAIHDALSAVEAGKNTLNLYGQMKSLIVFILHQG